MQDAFRTLNMDVTLYLKLVYLFVKVLITVVNICFKNNWISNLFLCVLWLCGSPEHWVNRLTYVHVQLGMCNFNVLPRFSTQYQNYFYFSWSFFNISWIKVSLATCVVSNFGIIGYVYCKVMHRSLNSWDFSLAKSWYIKVAYFLQKESSWKR